MLEELVGVREVYFLEYTTGVERINTKVIL